MKILKEGTMLSDNGESYIPEMIAYLDFFRMKYGKFVSDDAFADHLMNAQNRLKDILEEPK